MESFSIQNKETVELVSDGFITSDSVNTCDECWDKLNHLYDETEDMLSDADPGL